jgi:hypothetical protein
VGPATYRAAHPPDGVAAAPDGPSALFGATTVPNPTPASATAAASPAAATTRRTLNRPSEMRCDR